MAAQGVADFLTFPNRRQESKWRNSLPCFLAFREINALLESPWTEEPGGLPSTLTSAGFSSVGLPSALPEGGAARSVLGEQLSSSATVCRDPSAGPSSGAGWGGDSFIMLTHFYGANIPIMASFKLPTV